MSSMGKNVKITLFGESHGPYVGAVLEGVPAGKKIDYEYISVMLSRRRPKKDIETKRVEEDKYEIVSGAFNGYTCGTPICILVPNRDVDDAVYEKNKNIMRPSQVDYVSHVKYHGFEDYRGSGHFSGRISVAIVIAGAIAKSILEQEHIKIASHILNVGKVKDDKFKESSDEVNAQVNYLLKGHETLLDLNDDIVKEILNAKDSNDSIGGSIECAVTGLKAGVGDAWFDSLEGQISKAMFAIGGVKGIEFGKGFEFANGKGSQMNDSFEIKDGTVCTKTNNNGGINGGISNGMPIIFRLVIRPTASISKEQDTIDIEKLENTKLSLVGRHDPAIVRRICVVVESALALVIYDNYLSSKLD